MAGWEAERRRGSTVPWPVLLLARLESLPPGPGSESPIVSREMLLQWDAAVSSDKLHVTVN